MRAMDIMYPEDAKAIQVIRSVPGCERLIRTYLQLGYERQLRGENLANCVQVTSESFPRIYTLFREVVRKVGIQEPELYVYNDPVINGYTFGETRPFVALSSSLIEHLDEEELKGKVDEIFERGIIQAEALNYIRGRSIVKTYLIIDEAQNTTPDQIKGIITRAGKDTKIILLGDPNQIDRPFLDERTNGLSYASEHMKGSPLCWQITMTAQECERSALAMEAVRRL